MNLSDAVKKIVIVTIPLPLFPPSKGYLVMWSCKMYFYFYIKILFGTIKGLKVGNIFSSLLVPFKGIMYAKDMVDTNLDQIRILAYESYKALANVWFYLYLTLLLNIEELNNA